MQDFRWLKEIWEGKRYKGQNVEQATAVITAVTRNLFTVAGGKIWLLSLVGTITVNIQALATNVRLSSNPTTGTTRNLCANLNIASYQAGDLLGITGVIADPMIPPATGGALEDMTFGVLVQAGTIDLIADAAPTGSVRWTLKYAPFDDGASVSAA